jgi:hypothetical protein
MLDRANGITESYEAYCARHGVAPIAWSRAWQKAVAAQPLPPLYEQLQFFVFNIKPTHTHRMVYDAISQAVSQPEAVLGVRVSAAITSVWVAPREGPRLHRLKAGDLLHDYSLEVPGRQIGMHMDNYLLTASGLITQLKERRDGVLYHRPGETEM